MITPIILCGGIGERLWPISRTDNPKQFVKIFKNESLFERTLKRLDAEIFDKPIIVTTSEQLTLAQAAINNEADIIVEPEGKNTASSVISAVLRLDAMTPNKLFCVMPADHFLDDIEYFEEMMKVGLVEANKGRIVTFGKEPKWPETGFGYIEVSSLDQVTNALSFTEKPNQKTAIEMLKSGLYLWNMGICLAKADTMISQAKMHSGEVLSIVQNAIIDGKAENNLFYLDKTQWTKLPNISLDHAIMEFARNITTIRFEKKWSDVGNWESASEVIKSDETLGPSTSINSKDTTLINFSKDIQLVGFGLNNIITIAAADAILVADRTCIKNLKEVTQKLRENGAPQLNQSREKIYEWGIKTNILNTEKYKINKYVITTDKVFSWKAVQCNSSMWRIVSGVANVTVEGQIKKLPSSNTFNVHRNEQLCIQKRGNDQLVIIQHLDFNEKP